MGTVLAGTISGHTLQQHYLELIAEDVIFVMMRDLVSLEQITLALLHIVTKRIIVILTLSGTIMPSSVLVMKHSTDN